MNEELGWYDNTDNLYPTYTEPDTSAVTQENAGYWKVDKWSLSDLSKLTVKLKNEFNASN